MRMFLAVAVTTLLLVMAQAPTLEAQDPPDFSGSWTLAETEGGPPAGAAGQRAQGQAGQRGQGQMGQRRGMGMLAGLGQQATLTQEGNILTVVRTTPQGEIRQVYNLDGSESTNRLTMGNNQIEQVSKASWDGAALMIVSQIPMGGQSIETRMKLSIDADGKLVVETTRSGGPGGQGGGTVRTTYTKG